MECDFIDNPENDLPPLQCRWCGHRRSTFARRRCPRRGNPLEEECRHFGAPMGKFIERRCCGGQVARHELFQCGIFGECLPLEVSKTDITSCSKCDWYAPMRWAAYVTTAPRLEPKLDDTLASLNRGGWLDAAVMDDADKRLGCWGNFRRCLELGSALDVDAVVVFQDDIQVARNARRYIDATLLRSEDWHDIGFASLYTSANWDDATDGWQVRDVDGSRYGALAVVFSPERARQCLDETKGRKLPAHGTDSRINRWAQAAGLPVAVHQPSLVQHTGKSSSIRLTDTWTNNSYAARVVEDCDRLPIRRNSLCKSSPA